MNKLLSLLQLSDPALPIGGFSHSYGLETYVQYGIVNNKEKAKEFVTAQLSQNIVYTDAAFVSLAYDAAQNANTQSLFHLDDECNAVKLARETRQASQKLGLRLLKLFSSVKEDEMISEYRERIISKKSAGHYSIVFGLLALALEIKKIDALTGFFYNAAAGMVTNSVKLIPLGQQDGQELLFSLQPLIENLVLESLYPRKESIGLCCTGFDIRCMQHEQLYSRLYMS